MLERHSSIQPSPLQARVGREFSLESPFKLLLCDATRNPLDSKKCQSHQTCRSGNRLQVTAPHRAHSLLCGRSQFLQPQRPGLGRVARWRGIDIS
jgi:hypothetical protein